MPTQKNKTLLQIVYMCLGFFGIQFAWGLQQGNMSAIYARLGADPDKIAMLWLAAPVTGLLVQPIIGYFSDRTWCRLGRRRPYFLGGAIFSVLALILMPLSPAIWVAAMALWILDTSVNASMEPFRAFVGDILPEQQRKIGYTMQSIMIGAGAVLALYMPQLLTSLGVSIEAPLGHIPNTVKYSFFIGSVVLLITIAITIIKTPEYPPQDKAAFEEMKKQPFSPVKTLKEMGQAMFTMPLMMRRLAVVQFFTWAAFMAMWAYFAVGIAQDIFKVSAGTPEFEAAATMGSNCFALYNAVAFVFSFALLWLAKKFSAKQIHTCCLIIGGAGLLSLLAARTGLAPVKPVLIFSMVGVGIAWSSILSMPYALLSNALPADKMGFYMGVFNFFIVLPQICVSLFAGFIMKHFLGGSPLSVVSLGGVGMLLAAASMYFVKEPHDIKG
jgi:maltose/moltooligosaccharide transporter